MSLLSILVALLLGALALVFVLYPLYRHAGPALFIPIGASGATSTSDVPGEREQAARSALQEVELDYQLGNLSDDDYGSLRERYLNRALLALKSRHEREQELDAEIEEQLRLLKENEGNEDAIE